MISSAPLVLVRRYNSDQSREYPSEIPPILASIRSKVAKGEYSTIINQMAELQDKMFGKYAPIIYNFINLIMENRAIYKQFCYLLQIMKRQSEEIKSLTQRKVSLLIDNNSRSQMEWKAEVISLLENKEMDAALRLCHENQFYSLSNIIKEVKEYRWLVQRNKQCLQNYVKTLRDWKLPDLQFEAERQQFKQFLEKKYAQAYQSNLDCINIQDHFYIQHSFSKACQLIDTTYRQQRIRSILKNQYKYFQKQKWLNELEKLILQSQILIDGTIFKPTIEQQQERLSRLYDWLDRLIKENKKKINSQIQRQKWFKDIGKLVLGSEIQIDDNFHQNIEQKQKLAILQNWLDRYMKENTKKISALKRKNESRTTIDSAGSNVMAFSRVFSEDQLPKSSKSPPKFQGAPSLINNLKNQMIPQQYQPQSNVVVQRTEEKKEQSNKQELEIEQEFRHNSSYTQSLRQQNRALTTQINQLQEQRQALKDKHDYLQDQLNQLKQNIKELCNNSKILEVSITDKKLELESQQSQFEKLKAKVHQTAIFTEQLRCRLLQNEQKKAKLQKFLNQQIQLRNCLKQQSFENVSISSSHSQYLSSSLLQNEQYISKILNYQEEAIIRRKLYQYKLKIAQKQVININDGPLSFDRFYSMVKNLSHILLIIKLKTNSQQVKIIGAYCQNSNFRNGKIIPQSQINTFGKKISDNSFAISQISDIENQQVFSIPQEFEQSLPQLQKGFIYTSWNQRYFLPVKKVKLFNIKPQKKQVQIGREDLRVSFKSKKLRSFTGLDTRNKTAFANNGNPILWDALSTVNIESLELHKLNQI